MLCIGTVVIFIHIWSMRHDMSSQVPSMAKFSYTQSASVFAYTRVFCDVALKTSGRATTLATELTPVWIIATVYGGLMLVETMRSCKAPTTLQARVFTRRWDARVWVTRRCSLQTQTQRGQTQFALFTNFPKRSSHCKQMCARHSYVCRRHIHVVEQTYLTL